MKKDKYNHGNQVKSGRTEYARMTSVMRKLENELAKKREENKKNKKDAKAKEEASESNEE